VGAGAGVPPPEAFSVTVVAGVVVAVDCPVVFDDDEMAHAPETRLTTNRLARSEQRKRADEAPRDAMGSTPTTSVARKAAKHCGMGHLRDPVATGRRIPSSERR
jgi:hypothetical protein